MEHATILAAPKRRHCTAETPWSATSGHPFPSVTHPDAQALPGSARGCVVGGRVDTLYCPHCRMMIRRRLPAGP